MTQTQLAAPPAVVTESGQFSRVGRSHPERALLEASIARRYWRAHQASRCHFLDHLLVVRSEEGALRAGLGIGEGNQPFFLERYLDGTAEDAIQQATGHTVAREALVEIGTLVSHDRAAATSLMLLTIAWLAGYGADWGVFTATRVVRDRMSGLGISLLDLGAADPTRLGPAAEDWGRYYRADPRVVAASFEDARRLLAALPGDPDGPAAEARVDGARARAASGARR